MGDKCNPVTSFAGGPISLEKHSVSLSDMVEDDEVAVGHRGMPIDEDASDLSGCCGETTGVRRVVER